MATQKGNGPECGRQDPEAAGTFTGTGLIMAHSQEVLRIDPRGKNTTNTISRAELVGVQTWLKQVNWSPHNYLQAAYR